jgi:DNA polymerase-3 subunit gamma/tau
MDQNDAPMPAANSADEPGLDLGGGGPATPPARGAADSAYRVLARKYRPATFDDLVGQEAMVRTLSNAFASGRIAHAFMLTGVRGVGKTTTARIIAMGLNCTALEAEGRPTISPCGKCESCVSIAASRNVDVFEMDAASHTGIDDIREIIEQVRYAPVAARNKVYIIDEVHMLSTQAFNALLKTLEEPPPHVKFIFATTEIRKVPVTVLSRCQRFDLRRIDAERLIGLLRDILHKEGAKAEPGALALIARAAEGSARDALSLTDQALSYAEAEDGVQWVREDAVRAMLGLADRARIVDLFDHLMAGDIGTALNELAAQYEVGADPVVVLNDLLDFTHWLTRLKVLDGAAEDAIITETELKRGREMAGKLSLPALSRAWQTLLKGLSETREAPDTRAAAEMVLIRLAHMAELPTPDEVIRQLNREQGTGAPAQAPSPASSGGSSGGTAAMSSGGAATARAPRTDDAPREAPRAQARPSENQLACFEDVVAMAHEKREVRLFTDLEDFVHLVRFEAGRIEFRPADNAPGDLAQRLAEKLKQWTGARWMVTLSREEGAPTLSAQRRASEERARAEALADPLVKAALEAFPDARVLRIEERALAAAPQHDDMPAEAEDDANDTEQS